MSVMNTAWHNANPLPETATPEERVKWHDEHEKNCGCRPIEQSLAAQPPETSNHPPHEPLDTNLDCD